MEHLNRTSEFIDNLNRKIGEITSYLAIFMVLGMFFNVVARYAFGLNLVWQQELIGFMHAILFLAAAGYTFLDDKHVRVDVFYQRANDKTKAYIDMLGVIFFLMPVTIGIGYLSYDFIIDSWKIFEKSSEYNGIYGVFLLKTCIWIFCATLFLQGVSIICKSIIKVKK